MHASRSTLMICGVLLLAVLAAAEAGASSSPAQLNLPGFQVQPKAGSMDPVLGQVLVQTGPDGRMGAFIQFPRTVPYAESVTAIEALGLTVGLHLPAAHAVYAHGRAARLVAASWISEVAYLENVPNARLDNDTGTWATRSRPIYDVTGGLDLRVEGANGNVIDGSGVGIAIVDSGVDGDHPDLEWCNGADPSTCKTIKNFKVECSTPVLINTLTSQCFGQVVMNDQSDTDTSSGHGSHVSGIAAGDGTASDSDGNPATTGDRMFRGVAPGAKIYGFGTGEGISILVLNAVAAYQWIYDNGPVQNPPIRVINNSWGGTTANATINNLVNALIRDRGITVVFSASNAGGDGTTATTNIHGRNPTPGVLMAANYDDDLRGTRDFQLSTDSSRGAAGDPSTWPDLSAPGSFVTSSCVRGEKPVCLTGFVDEAAYFPFYASISGTSMAAPHVAGVAALLYDADPDITPAEIEDVLEDTAYKFTFGAAYAPDPANPDNTSSFDKGHGLVDARRAVLARVGLPPDTGTSTGGSPSVAIGTPEAGETVPTSFRVAGGASTGDAADGTLVTVIATGDGGDYDVDSLDLQEVVLVEDAGSGTVRIEWTVSGTTTAPAGGQTFTYRLFSDVDGVTRRLQVRWDGTNVVNASDLGDAANPVPAVAVGKTGDTFFAVFSAAVLGATRGVIHFDPWAATYLQVIQDRAPGGEGGTFITAPARGQEHVFVAAGSTGPGPVGAVHLSVDGGPFGSAVASAPGSFTWDDTLALTPRPACYDLSAGLWLAPSAPPSPPDATDSACVFVSDAPIGQTIMITVPEDGSDSPASPILVRGIANYDPTGVNVPRITVRGVGGGGYETFEFEAVDDSTGGLAFSRWSAAMDLTTAVGQTVTITSRLYLDDVLSAVDSVSTLVVPGAGAVPDGHTVPGVVLTVDKVPDDDTHFRLNWGESCLVTDVDYGVFVGEIGDFASHVPWLCGIPGGLGQTTAMILDPGENAYILVVPLSSDVGGPREGSYGVDSRGVQRPQGPEVCWRQAFAPCQ